MGLTGSGAADEPLTVAERQFLIESGLQADSFDPVRVEEARASLRRRAEKTRQEAAPELTADQVASLLGCDVPQVLAWTESRDLFAYETEDGLRIPEWQFPHGQRLPGLRLALSPLTTNGWHPYSVEGFMSDVRHEELDDLTVVQWLAAGHDPDAALILATSATREG